jgi:hypothetical protein
MKVIVFIIFIFLKLIKSKSYSTMGLKGMNGTKKHR